MLLQILDVRLKESGQAVKIAARLDVADDRHQRGRIDQLAERNVVEFQLAGDGDHDAVEPFFDQGTIRPDAQLAAQHHVERLRAGAAAFVSELHAGDLPLLAGLLGVLLADQVGEQPAEVELGDGDVAVLVAGDALDVLAAAGTRRAPRR